MSAAQQSHIIALTGGAGMMATLLRPFLAAAGHSVRLLDIVPAADPGPQESVHVGNVADLDFMVESLTGCTGVVHLGGIHREQAWEDLVQTNITGTRATLEAAYRNGVEHVLLASSTHAVGFHPSAAAIAGEPLVPRPDSYYGVSKAAMEALGGLYADKYAMKVVSARIGTGGTHPGNTRTLSSWLSPADSARLVEATLNEIGAPGHHVVWAVSANTRGWVDTTGGQGIGYFPQDNAEDFAGAIDEVGQQEWDQLLGGYWSSAGHKLGIDNFPRLVVP